MSIFKNKQALIIISVVVFVFLLAVVPILINVFSDTDDNVVADTPDTGEVLSGKYSMSLGSTGSSTYTFDGDKVTNVYNDTTIEYTYVLAVENGEKVIKLTTTDEDGKSQTTTHSFETGKFGDTPIIRINGEIYYLEK